MSSDKEKLQKIAMTLLSKEDENKKLKDDLHLVKKASDVDSLLKEMVERGFISEEVKESKREDLMSKTAEEIATFKQAVSELTNNTPAIGEVAKAASGYAGKDAFENWLLNN